MRTFLTSLALASSILSANAINLVERRDGSAPKVVQHQIQRRRDADPLKNHRERLQRRDTVTASLANEETLYYISVDIGTPAQNMQLHIDTGSSDLWVNVPNSQLCEGNGSPCSASGTFDPGSSSTYKVVNDAFNITYVDGSGASGDYAEDTVSFSNVKLDDQQFGVGFQSTSYQGVLGIGYPINEAITQQGYSPYINVPQNLVQKGYINSNAYSLWLDDLDASTGQIVFGGVNTDKFSGKLSTLPIVPLGGRVYSAFIIALTEVAIDGTSIASNLAIGALLDSGSSLMYLPNDIAQAIYKSVNAQYDARQGLAYVDCNLANSDATIDFTFSSPTIKVPMSEVVLNAGSQCVLGIGMSGSSSSILGDTFIRSAYVVYDIDNNQIAIAQTDFSSTSDNIVEIGSNGDIPSATVVQNAQTSVAAASGGAINVGFSSSSGVPNAAQPTAAVGYNMALLGAAGAAILAL